MNRRSVQRIAALCAASAAAVTLGTTAAHADVIQVGCSNSGQAAVEMKQGGATSYACYEGTGPSWTGRLLNVTAVRGGNYTIVASILGSEDPVTAGPGQTTTLQVAGIVTDVQLL